MTSAMLPDSQAGLTEALLTRLAVEDFLMREAAALDERAFKQWLEIFDEDVLYEMPVRVTREADADWQLSPRSRIFKDDLRSLTIRADRLSSEFAWAEQPPSCTRHFVTNVLVDPGDDGDLVVRSNLLVFRQRADRNDLVSCARRDLMRRHGSTFRVRHRVIMLDEARGSSHNFSWFF